MNGDIKDVIKWDQVESPMNCNIWKILIDILIGFFFIFLNQDAWDQVVVDSLTNCNMLEILIYILIDAVAEGINNISFQTSIKNLN